MQELNNIFQNLKNEFLELIPNILTSLLVLGIGYLIARLVKYLIIKLINHLGVILKRRFKLINLKQAGFFIGTAFFWLIIFSSVLLITDILGLTVLTNWFAEILQYTPNVIAAILIIFAAIIIGNFLYDFVESLSTKAGLEYGTTLGRIAQFFVISMAIVIAMDQIGIEITFLINIIAIVLGAILFGGALAFGIGSRTSVSNILGSFYVRKTYKEGDDVQIGKVRGRILKINPTNVVLDAEIGQVTIPAKEFNTTKSFLITKK